MIVRQSNRVAMMEEPDKEALMTVLPEDLGCEAEAASAAEPAEEAAEDSGAEE